MVRHTRWRLLGVAPGISGLSYDATIKIEHLLKHSEELPRLRDTGCLFVTSAVESVDDAMLERLENVTRARIFWRWAKCAARWE